MVIPLPPWLPAGEAFEERRSRERDRRIEGQATYPGAFGRATRVRSPIWSCSLRGLPSRPGHPGRWWALTPPFHPYLRTGHGPARRRSVFCGTFLPVTGTGGYPAQCPVEFGLSSPRAFARAATIRITPAPRILAKARNDAQQRVLR